ncbi:MAG: class I SAM-dependent methyltransferase [Candidatus Odinarchaeota archaeon]
MPKKKFMLDPKKRFSSRVENYIKFRPNYPYEIIKFLKEKNILQNDSIIADIGSGTGILSELFLKNGNVVYGIEPNADMRNAAEKLLENYSDFITVDGSAERTNLKAKNIDVITVGQAFHWFDIRQTQKEFKRILREGGYVVLIWNNRKKSGNGFSNEYEKFILKYGKDYKFTRKDEMDINNFFQYEKKVFYNYQDFDFEGLKGRLLSASYIPLEDSPEYEDMIKELANIFNKYQHNGIIKLEYDTEVYYGSL